MTALHKICSKNYFALSTCENPNLYVCGSTHNYYGFSRCCIITGNNLITCTKLLDTHTLNSSSQLKHVLRYFFQPPVVQGVCKLFPQTLPTVEKVNNIKILCTTMLKRTVSVEKLKISLCWKDVYQIFKKCKFYKSSFDNIQGLKFCGSAVICKITPLENMVGGQLNIVMYVDNITALQIIILNVSITTVSLAWLSIWISHLFQHSLNFLAVNLYN